MKTTVKSFILALVIFVAVLIVGPIKSIILEPPAGRGERSAAQVVRAPAVDVSEVAPPSAESTVCCATSQEKGAQRSTVPTSTTVAVEILHKDRGTPPAEVPPSPAPDTATACCDISEGLDVEPYCNGSDRLALHGCTCAEVLLCRMVAVSALSSNHFAEAQDNIGSLQKYFPRTKIIVYDLGLTGNERRRLGTYCNVEVRNFSFERYPDHVRDLDVYAWKPLLVSEVARQYEVLLYGDSSVRMKSSDMVTVLKSLVTFPFVSGIPHSQPIISLTHDGMIHYLHSPPRRELAGFTGTQGGVWLMWANRVMKARVISAWEDCALNRNCISPEGATKGPCNFTKEAFSEGLYVGCHRYDQSALNMILVREFGPSISKSIARWDLTQLMWHIKRQASHDFIVHDCIDGQLT